ncbi:MAG: DEAD/DEAH box helicase family protein [Candidatus Schekmanbacteria bacterium]|nr:DEAD/DEAH box helicase family protein [Candidatus Schekmanbacteria bacterium]
MPLLTDYTWKTKYDSDEDNLLDDFYDPVLACALRYDRSTGYFSAGVLTLAARGIEGIVRNNGRMRLVVGCTLDEPEVQAIERGEALKDVAGARLARVPLSAESAVQADALELLAWMVGRGYLEVRVAVPCHPETRHPCPSDGIFHEKAGIVEDKTGDRLAFNGSVNETRQGWRGNWESFHVFTAWGGDREHVDTEDAGFAKLWNDRMRRCLTIAVPDAARDQLLRFLPESDRLPGRLQDAAAGETPDEEPAPAADPPPEPAPVDIRRLLWGWITHAAAFANGGERVGEATSAVAPWPHQIRAFHRMYDRWPPRCLVADEVGLGKTIQASMVLRQAWLSGRARRILILAPKAVLIQWQIELREKFNLNWPIYDGGALRWYPCPALDGRAERQVSRSEWHREPCVLAGSQLMRRAERRKELLEQADPWDLIILDEAHHARRRGGCAEELRPNQLLRLMEGLRERTQGLILLTATPMQVDPVEVWDLLHLLGLPPAWTAQDFVAFFDKLGTGNPSHDDFEYLARMFREVEAFFGETPIDLALRHVPKNSKLAAKKILQALRDEARTGRRQLDTDRRRAALKIMKANTPIARLVSRHTRELLRAYFAAGKIDTPVPRRQVEDVFIDLSAPERALYEALETYISSTYNAAAVDQRTAIGFVMTIYRRRLASSFYALQATLKKRLEALRSGRPPAPFEDDDILEDDLQEEVLDAEEAAELAAEALLREEQSEIQVLLDAVKVLPADTKVTVLVAKIRELREGGYKQVMIFTEFTDTMDFLRKHLVKKHGMSVLCYSGRGGELPAPDGTWRVITRDETKRIFREKAADVLLCTDAAAEGLNFQFCGALVNYSMPWNPMKGEQRIGRIDRLGSAFSEIRIVNLHYRDTVETDVYMVLRERIGLFSQFVGKLQPILSAVTNVLTGATLAPLEHRDRVRAELASGLAEKVREAEEGGFDLDGAAAADLDMPARPAPLYDLKTLDQIIRSAKLLPPGVEARPLGRMEYELSMPGMQRPLRVTTDPEYFDAHPGSTELFSPGSPLFPTLDGAASSAELTGQGGLVGEISRLVSCFMTD